MCLNPCKHPYSQPSNLDIKWLHQPTQVIHTPFNPRGNWFFSDFYHHRFILPVLECHIIRIMHYHFGVWLLWCVFIVFLTPTSAPFLQRTPGHTWMVIKNSSRFATIVLYILFSFVIIRVCLPKEGKETHFICLSDSWINDILVFRCGMWALFALALGSANARHGLAEEGGNAGARAAGEWSLHLP